MNTNVPPTIENPRNAAGVKKGVSRLLQSLPFLGIVMFSFVTTFPPFEVETEINLPVHMAQHVLIAVAGILISYPLYNAGKFARIKGTRLGLIGFLALAVLVIFWHIPTYWDAAVLNPVVHIAEHFCFLAVGLLIGGLVPMLPDNFKMLALILAVSAHMFYGFILYLTTTPIYPLYPVSQQSLLGVLMFAPSPIYFIGFLYFTLSRESKKLQNRLQASSHSPIWPRRNLGHLAVAALSILMIIVLSGYLALTVAAISNSPIQNSSQVSVVYILETPVTWQYSPQTITLVLGVNNTVEWISHSLTYDTVTSNNGTFSHSFSPGGAFEFTFTSPGVYPYYCLYHPWMHGVVVVLGP